MVKPLKEMSRAAKSFAKGNFNTRVAVRGSDEIAELAVAFNNMATSLASLEELRTGFIANVSHDLRTPMTTISGFIDGILDGTIPREDESHYLTVVSNEIKRLSKLVHTLLELSKIESGQIEYHPVRFDICESMRKLLLSFEQSINNKRLQVELSLCEERFEVVADEDAIARVMYNLIDNAIKFSYPDGVLTLSITRGDKNDRNVYVSVKNTGVGIPESDLPYVFERFYKSDKSRGLDKTGSGLGLYIVKSIIDRHGGRITVKSVQNEFCEFVFSLPLETEEK
nr:HAMP domain-containing sensor histidine kinase [Feifania hominis]